MAFGDFLSSLSKGIGNIFTGGRIMDEIIPQNSRFPGDPGSGGINGGPGPVSPSGGNTGGGGIGDIIGAILGGGSSGSSSGGGFDFGKLVVPLLLGGGSMLASRLIGAGEQKNIDRALKSLRSGSDVAMNAGKTLVNRASAGKLTDPQQATVDRMKAEQNARWSQYMANLGIPVSSSMVQAQNLVDTQATELANKLINESFDQGIKALSLGGTASTQLLQSAMAQKNQLSQTIAEVAKQIGMVLNQPPQGQTRETRVPVPWTDYGEYPDANEYGY